MTPNEIRALIDRYIDAYNRQNVDDLMRCVHPMVEFSNVTAGVLDSHTVGVAELRALAQQSLSLFSERRQTVETIEVRDTAATVTIAFRAVVAADLPNGLKQGQVLTLSGRTEFEFQDGAIARITDIS